ncbi:S-layer homology domain-containing protein [Bacillus cereus]|uniref:S-layer homology domain-containing protein n=1 Tax=Bacillus cereus TaxID=1396 RepID=UPI000BF74D6C|nr:S-layer homology domain-containing protein [Bacillus cereus]PFA67233.1 hypothetical protein CN403_23410 [Bacillus cereus]
MRNKLIAAGVITGTLLSYSSNIFADTQRFPDVPNWAEQSVNYLVDKHAINGLPNGTFGSYESLDRASAAKIITKALGIKINLNEKPSFKDAQNHWGAPYIAAAEKAGIVKGEGNGLFNPSEKVTRVAMAAMLVNAYKLQSQVESGGKTKFKDLQGHWGAKPASILIDLGISNGTDNGWLPNRIITRAEAAQLIAKTDMLKNRGGGTLKNSKETISAIKEERMDGVVSSIIRDTNGDYIKINYKDKNGEEHSVYVGALKNHLFKEGDTVKVSDGGLYGKMVFHKRFGYNTTEYTSSNSKVLTDLKEAITKVNEKQKEDFVIGEVEDIFKDGSFDDIQVRLKDNEGKKQYVDVPVSQGHSYKKGDKVQVGNKGEWKEIASNPYMTTWMSPKESISKLNENEKQKEDFVIGEIYNADRYHVSVKYINNKGQTDYVHVNTSNEHDFKDGDRVKVINKKNWNGRFALEGSISKVND